AVSAAPSRLARPAARPSPASYFFFQAEDGIRHRNVTGVQTCALPISPTCTACASSAAPATWAFPLPRSANCWTFGTTARAAAPRSEERRVGTQSRRRRPRGRRRQRAADDRLRYQRCQREGGRGGAGCV